MEVLARHTFKHIQGYYVRGTETDPSIEFELKKGLRDPLIKAKTYDESAYLAFPSLSEVRPVLEAFEEFLKANPSVHSKYQRGSARIVPVERIYEVLAIPVKDFLDAYARVEIASMAQSSDGIQLNEAEKALLKEAGIDPDVTRLTFPFSSRAEGYIGKTEKFNSYVSATPFDPDRTLLPDLALKDPTFNVFLETNTSIDPRVLRDKCYNHRNQDGFIWLVRQTDNINHALSQNEMYLGEINRGIGLQQGYNNTILKNFRTKIEQALQERFELNAATGFYTARVYHSHSQISASEVYPSLAAAGNLREKMRQATGQSKTVDVHSVGLQVQGVTLSQNDLKFLQEILSYNTIRRDSYQRIVLDLERMTTSEKLAAAVNEAIENLVSPQNILKFLQSFPQKKDNGSWVITKEKSESAFAAVDLTKPQAKLEGIIPCVQFSSDEESIHISYIIPKHKAAISVEAVREAVAIELLQKFRGKGNSTSSLLGYFQATGILAAPNKEDGPT